MIITAVSVVRNEEDIIEAWVRHNRPQVERFIITLHRCTDATPFILQQLQEEGFDLEITESNVIGHRQAETITALIHEAALGRPDYILPLDGDEFICGDLRRINAHWAWTVLLRWRHYVPQGDVIDPLKQITGRLPETDDAHKVLIPGWYGLSERCHVGEGSHELYIDATPAPCCFTDQAWLAHFPVRSGQQIMKKAFTGWLGKLANDLEPGGKDSPAFYCAWKSLFDAAKTGEMDVAMATRRYNLLGPLIEEPLPHQELRYTPQCSKTAWEVLADMAEEMAGEVRRLR